MNLHISSMILTAALLVTGALAQDTPSASFMDPKVEEVLKTMGHALAGTSAFAFTAEDTRRDERHPSGMKIQRTGRRAMAIRRPDRIISDVEGDLGTRSAWYDGKSIAVLDKVHNTYAVLDIPSSPSGPSGIDAALIEKNEVVRSLPRLTLSTPGAPSRSSSSSFPLP